MDGSTGQLERWLVDFVTASDGVAGTVHWLGDDALRLACAHNIPPQVRDATRVIPCGKGMAGLAWQRGEPVQTCNLKTDRTGDVRPGAAAVDALGAIAIPVYRGDGAARELAGVVGVAFADERELDPATVARLTLAAHAALEHA